SAPTNRPGRASIGPAYYQTVSRTLPVRLCDPRGLPYRWRAHMRPRRTLALPQLQAVRNDLGERRFRGFQGSLAGEMFYLPPGHVPAVFEEDTACAEFSPQDSYDQLLV